MFKRLLLLFVLVVLIAGGFTAYILMTPYAGYDKEVFVDIPPGTTTQEMARQLEDAGVIRGKWGFMLARALSMRANLQAGEYRFDRPMSVLDVYGKIARGEIFYHELRVPEGANMFDIAAKLEELGLMKNSEFLRAARNPGPIHDIAPAAPSLEGYLFPSTYRFRKRTTAEQVAREMTAQFRKVWSEVGGGAEDVNRMVTLASLVEKETGVPAERGAVASVYKNRLDIGMRLDCDPTVIYAALLENRYRGTIYRSDLDNPHPYNTYRNPGLPPGPIANPGRASLEAALRPSQTSYLYFVAKPGGSGEHLFATTLSEHDENVAAYRRQPGR